MSEQTAEGQQQTTPPNTPTAITVMEISPNPGSNGANQQPEANNPTVNDQEAEIPITSPEIPAEAETPGDEAQQEVIADLAREALAGNIDPEIALQLVAEIPQLGVFNSQLQNLARKSLWRILQELPQEKREAVARELEKLATSSPSENWHSIAERFIQEAGENNPRLKALGLEIQKAALQDQINFTKNIPEGKRPPQLNEALQQAEAKMQQVEEELNKLREQNSENLGQLSILYKILTGKDFKHENPNLNAIPIALAEAAMTQEARKALIDRLKRNLDESPEANQFINSLNSTLDEIQKNAPDIEKILTGLKRKERLKGGFGIILLLLIALGLITYKTALAEEKS